MKEEPKNTAEYRNEIGHRLKIIRLNKKYTQEQMGEVLGVSSKYYGRIERGEYFLTLEKLLILHKVLKVDLNYLLSGEVECTKKN